MNNKITNEELLRNPKVIEEIKRHCWIESEKAKRDIGFDNAAKDWLAKYSKAWISYHMPDANKELPKKEAFFGDLNKNNKVSNNGGEDALKKRKAKSYNF